MAARLQIAILAVLGLPSLLFGQELPPSTSTVRTFTLKETYLSALKTSERIALSDQLVRQAEALYRQTYGSSFPELLYRHQTVWQDQTRPASDGMIRISKTDLTGYRELAALKSGRSVIAQRRYERQRIEQLLFGDVATAFFGVLQAKENLSSTRRLSDLAGKRLRELRERVRVGRTREADAIEQEFQIIALQSQLEENERLLKLRVDLLGFLAGVPVTDPVATEDSISRKFGSLEDYLPRIETRPDVRAARESSQSAESLIQLARSEYFPGLDLSANYYLYRPDSRKNTDWDTTLTLNAPLYNWGARRASLDAARAVFGQRQELLRAARKLAELEVRNAYRNYLSSKKQLDFQEKSVQLARRDYELQLRDDRQGLVTSLEVLEALNRLNRAELAFNSAQLEQRLATLNLEIVSGATPEEILK